MPLKLKHLLFLVVGISLPAWASPNFSTRDLDTKDYAEMGEIVHKESLRCYAESSKGKESFAEMADDEEIDASGLRQTPELRECLKGVIAMILSRREQNDAVQTHLLKKTMSEIQENYRIEVLKEITQDAIARYKKANDKGIQSTAYEQIKNILTEAKSRLKSEKEDVQPIIRTVKTADLDVDSKLASYRANGPSGITPNLSEKAEKILETFER